ncbi:hypothetical protein DQ384_38190 [Sphaerisporangium album]|uniref:Uncharacterized protein n=1 Tax=Sphaerisporangium album TaxID=509200 RepID=A0A367EN36_9ACTN|nr:hypothetical protein [Sphaerisporangium album]RCG19112.1 hypothetical protein DQ384_38190 [Sphaerisporangium album]
MRVVAPAAACVQVDGLSGRRYTARDGIYETSERDGRALLAAGGFLPSLSGATSRSTGYRCQACGFGAFIKTCSRCGGLCERE